MSTPRRSTRLLLMTATMALPLLACSTERLPGAGANVGPSCGPPPAGKCVQRRGCSAPVLVAMRCDDSTQTWSCPTGTRPYARATAATTSCRPFYSAQSGRAVHAGVSVETADGRCLWLLGAADDGAHPLAALPQDLEPGSCPSGPLQPSGAGGALHDAVDTSGAGADALVSLLHSVRVGGRSYIYYRLYVWDPNEVFGVRGLGVGVAPFDEIGRRLPVTRRLLWPRAQDFGDAVAFDRAASRLYLTGCGRSSGLVGDCHLARVDSRADLGAPASYQYYAGAGQWTRPGDGASARATLFSSGPERSVVRAHGGGYLHLFIAGFGDTIEVRRAPTIEGPWSGARPLVRCDLPAADPDAYCAEPMLHPELSDPTRPDELVLTHNVRTLAKDQAERRARNPAAYTLRLVRGQL